MQCEDVANVSVMKTLPHSIENITDDRHKYSAYSNWFAVLCCVLLCCIRFYWCNFGIFVVIKLYDNENIVKKMMEIN